MLESLLPTFVNTLTVLAGSGVGLLLHGRIPQRFRVILFQTIALVTLIIGLKDAMACQNIPMLALGMIAGSMCGEALKIEQRLEGIGDWLRRRTGAGGDSRFVDGFVSASLLFCVGAMTVVGALEAGVERNGEILYTKSLLDGHAAAFLAGALGAGVMAGALTVFTFQGALTLVFMAVGAQLPDAAVREIGAAGGLMIVAISLNLLELATIRVGNMLPGMVFAGLLAALPFV